MEQAEARKILEDLGRALRKQFPASDRMIQFVDHLATLQMVVDHLFDERARGQD
jgi:hypothetical protein